MHKTYILQYVQVVRVQVLLQFGALFEEMLQYVMCVILYFYIMLEVVFAHNMCAYSYGHRSL